VKNGDGKTGVRRVNSLFLNRKKKGIHPSDPLFQILKDGCVLAHQRPRVILLALLWKSIWLGVTALLIGAVGFWFAYRLANLQWQGPELALPKPIILAVTLQELLRAYSRTGPFILAGIVAVAVGSRIVLEAYFRGGAENFWVFAGSRLARDTILAASAVMLGILVWRDRTAGNAFIAAALMLGAWFLTTVAETLIRKDAVELLSADLALTASAMGILLMAELLSGVFLAGISTAILLLSSRFWEFVAAVGSGAVAALFWSVLQSYLTVVRFSTVDIMRGGTGRLPIQGGREAAYR